MKNAEETKTCGAGAGPGFAGRAAMCAGSLAICAMCVFSFPVFSNASENERYKAIPMASGGYVFILDTREGHAWTWSSGGAGGVSAGGANPRIVYQGNVRQNMRANPKNSASINQKSGERF